MVDLEMFLRSNPNRKWLMDGAGNTNPSRMRLRTPIRASSLTPSSSSASFSMISVKPFTMTFPTVSDWVKLARRRGWAAEDKATRRRMLTAVRPCLGSHHAKTTNLTTLNMWSGLPERGFMPKRSLSRGFNIIRVPDDLATSSILGWSSRPRSRIFKTSKQDSSRLSFPAKSTYLSRMFEPSSKM